MGGLCQWKIPATASGIEPTTIWLVAQCLNCANYYVTKYNCTNVLHIKINFQSLFETCLCFTRIVYCGNSHHWVSILLVTWTGCWTLHIASLQLGNKERCKPSGSSRAFVSVFYIFLNFYVRVYLFLWVCFALEPKVSYPASMRCQELWIHFIWLRTPQYLPGT